MEEQEQYAPEDVQESAEATPEDIGEQEVIDESGEVEEVAEPTPAEPEEKTVPLKAVQDERRKRQELKQEVEYWRKVALGEVDNPVKKDEAAPAAKPTADQFESYDDYVEALTDWKATEAVKRQQQTTQQFTREQIAQRENQKLLEKAARDAKAAAEKYPDFYDVAAAVTLPDQAMKAMYQSDAGPEIAYFLGKNPAEMERISELPPARQIMELGKLEVKLTAKAANPEKKTVKQATAVESAGNGFKTQNVGLQQLREQAQKTGNWQQYLIATGISDA